VRVHNDICHATQERQTAATTQVEEAELVLVVGDQRSNNSNRLVQVVREIAGKPALLIDDVSQVRPELLAGVSTVAVTSGSSTPSQVTRAVIQYLEQFEPDVAPE